jgi:hypothetical protein
MRFRFLATGMLFAAALAAAAPAYAQLAPSRVPRPSRTLFGGGQKPAEQKLTVQAAFGAGYDNDLTKPVPGIGRPPLRDGGFSLANSSLNYVIDQDKVRANFTFAARARYYPNTPVLSTYSGGGSLSTAFTDKTSMNASVHVGSYLSNMAIFGGDAYSNDPFSTGMVLVPMDTNPYTDGQTYGSLFTDVSLGHEFSKRIHGGANYAYYSNNAWSGGVGGQYGAQTAGMGISVDIAKGFGARLGYSYSGAGFGGANNGSNAYHGQSFDGGLTYGQSLSVTRKSSLSFSTGMSAVTDQSLDVRYFATGSANYSYELGRSWSMNASYNRSVNFYQILGQPTFIDQLSGGLGGGIGRRVQVSAGGGIVKGIIGTTKSAPGYVAANAGGGVRIGLARSLAFSVNYSFYHYNFDNGAVLPPGMLRTMDRQSVRISLDVWAPLYERARRNANVAR